MLSIFQVFIFPASCQLLVQLPFLFASAANCRRAIVHKIFQIRRRAAQLAAQPAAHPVVRRSRKAALNVLENI
jgi:hypothetical protein